MTIHAITRLTISAPKMGHISTQDKRSTCYSEEYLVIKSNHTVDGRNPNHQLETVVYPIIHRLSTILLVVYRISQPSTVCNHPGKLT
jgi:hypothetical protein